MTHKPLLAVLLSLPLLLVACDRSETSPTAAADSQHKQASTPDQMIQKAPPAAGMAPADSAAPSSSSMPPAAPASPSSTDSTTNQPGDTGAKTNQ